VSNQARFDTCELIAAGSESPPVHAEWVTDYGDFSGEYRRLRESVGLLDLTARARLCLTGADRQGFLHGQITNDVNALRVGDGCYAALVTAKGKMISDLTIYRLEAEILLDLEPGMGATVASRLERYIISEDVQVIDAGPAYGLLSLRGPLAARVATQAIGAGHLPTGPMKIQALSHPSFGEIYVADQPRMGLSGFDLYAPAETLQAAAEALRELAVEAGGGLCGFRAAELARMEAGIPRFGVDMDQSNLPPEAGLDSCAVSYRKGCYIGQEVLNRIRTQGQVAKALRRLRLADDLATLPEKGDALLHDGKEVGHITSAVASPRFKANIAFGYLRREVNAVGTLLRLRGASGESEVRVAGLPFEENFA
jgi:folate-binding protein YgfZ